MTGDATGTAPAPAGTRPMLAVLVGAGALLGIAWSSSLRGWMSQLAGSDSRFTWLGTFVGLILPGAMVGALLGWAEYLRHTHRPGRRWLALSPLLFPAAALSLPGAITLLANTGQGGAAIGVAILGMLGGIALSGAGPLWLRIPSGVVAFALVPALYLGPQIAAYLNSPMSTELDPATPHGAWWATNFSALFVTLAIACAIPWRHSRAAADGEIKARSAAQPSIVNHGGATKATARPATRATSVARAQPGTPAGGVGLCECVRKTPRSDRVCGRLTPTRRASGWNTRCGHARRARPVRTRSLA
jgi:hypothetical protein